MNKKQYAAVACALALTVTGVTAGAAAPEDFHDMPTNWSAAAVQFAIENDILQGDNGYLRPTAQLSRAEMATILNRVFGAETTEPIAFTDVASNAWYYTEVAKAVRMGTFVGVTDTLFAPSDSITREQAFTAIARAFRLTSTDHSSLAAFSDQAEIAGWAQDDIAALVAGQYVQGSNGRLRPKDTITRAEFCQTIYGLIAQFVSEAGTAPALAEGNIMVNEGGVTVNKATVTGDLVAGDGVMTDSFTLTDSTVGKRLLVRGGSTTTIYINNSKIADGIVVYNPNRAVRIITKPTTLVNNVDAQTSVTLEGHYGTVTISDRDAIVTIPVGSTVDKFVFLDGTTEAANVVYEKPAEGGGSTGGGGGGGGGTATTYYYDFKGAISNPAWATQVAAELVNQPASTPMYTGVIKAWVTGNQTAITSGFERAIEKAKSEGLADAAGVVEPAMMSELQAKYATYRAAMDARADELIDGGSTSAAYMAIADMANPDEYLDGAGAFRPASQYYSLTVAKLDTLYAQIPNIAPATGKSADEVAQFIADELIGQMNNVGIFQGSSPDVTAENLKAIILAVKANPSMTVEQWWSQGLPQTMTFTGGITYGGQSTGAYQLKLTLARDADGTN